MAEFTTEFFTGNRQRLQAELDAQLIVLSANGVLQRSADTTFPFRQDSNFWYLTGVEEPDFVLVIDGADAFFIAPRRDAHRDQWDGTIDKRAIKALSGITDIVEHHEGWNRLDKLLKKYKKVYTIAPAETYLEHFGFYANPARGALLAALQKHKKLEVVDIRKTLARMRQIKQPAELAAIQQAIDITAKALKRVQKKLSSYKNEREIVADLTHDFVHDGAAGHAYTPIVASGRNAATIHYIKNNQPINPAELLLLDVGAEVMGYSADITRTYAVSEPTKRQLEVFQAVMNVRAAAMELLKPGVDMKAYEQQVDKVMAGQLKKLGLIDDETDKKKLKKYYPHLTSHFLGLDTHDAADYQRPLEPGMVLTVEPGIYVSEENIGIRIEDDILITEDGVKNLCASLPVALI